MSVVVFLSGITMGDALGSAGRDLGSIFERLGLRFVEISLAKPEAPALLNKMVNEAPIQFVFSFAGMGAEMKGTREDGKETNLWEGLRVPFLSLYGDSPSYFFDRHVLPGTFFAGLYGFPEHSHLRKRLPGVAGLLATIPPTTLDLMDKKSIDFSKKEKGKLLFLKNGNDPDWLLSAWRRSVPEPVFVMLTDLASELMSQMHTDLGNDLDALVCSSFQSKGWDIEALVNLRLFFIAQLDDYLRRLKSTFIVEALLDLPIEIHGYNWEHVDFSNRRAKLITVADYAKSKSLIKESLALLDMSPNTAMAPHDRPTRAFGMYTLCLTNEQEYFNRNLPLHDAFSFRFEEESLKSKVSEVLSNPRRSVELGIEVAESFNNGREPEVLGRFLMDTASNIRLANAGRLPDLPDYFVWPPATAN